MDLPCNCLSIYFARLKMADSMLIPELFCHNGCDPFLIPEIVLLMSQKYYMRILHRWPTSLQIQIILRNRGQNQFLPKRHKFQVLIRVT